MKNIIKNTVLLVAFCLSLASCKKDWLETRPTTSDSVDVLYDMGAAGADMMITGINRMRFANFYANSNNAAYHFYGCGERSTDMMLDCLSGDFLSSGNKMTPFQEWGMELEFHVARANSIMVSMPWRYYYDVIDQVNNMLFGLDNNLFANMETQKNQFDFWRAQALIYRALSYHRLVQMYGKPVHSNPDALGVVIKDGISLEKRGRSTVREVYKQVIDDLKEAESLLNGSNVVRRDKTLADVKVVYGLLARVYACTHEWDLCEQYANKARAGVPLMSKDDFRQGFSAVNNEWMWASVGPSDEHQNAPNFFSLISNGTGYPAQWSYSVCVSRELVEYASASDCRFYGRSASGEEMAVEFLPEGYDAEYRQIRYNKFFLEGMQDFSLCYMRGAEMLLLEAEALCMRGNYTSARTLLNELLNARTNENNLADMVADGDLLDEVKMQTRMEMWNEGGLSYLNPKRRGDDIDLTTDDPKICRNGQFPQYNGRLATQVIHPDDPYMIWLIPQIETINNNLIIQN
ncbi:MAG: RagB/SusD family nutrient uptake outer membrane protein [Bacteroidales bacterium]|jgi:hypothetical protein|nr:RagB/SusD family nutrient uptake outer membrane protein [Bacteroidales bacterium]